MAAVTGAVPGHALASLLGRWEDAALTAGVLAAVVLAGLIAHAIVFFFARRIAARTPHPLDDVLARRLSRSTRLLIPALLVQLVRPALAGAAGVLGGVGAHLLSLIIIGAVAWFVVDLLASLAEVVRLRHPVDVKDNYNARRIHTQVTLLQRAVGVAVVLTALAAALMTFPEARSFGASLLASAGIVGLVIGIAARPVLENLLAGIQIALAQPINLDDVVIVEGEWGWIEQITATYVVVRIWDQRRLIVPFSKFISQPFQNWTRRSADILGTVFIYADYTLPVQALREELERVVRAAVQWDGRVCVLQVTDTTDRAMQLRALVSAANSPDAWDLRVHVREKLIEFMQAHYPECLPRVRLEGQDTARASADTER